MSTMGPENREAQPELKSSVERIVTQALGRAVRLTSMPCLTDPERRSEVYRCLSDEGDTFIAKRTPGFTSGSLDDWEMAAWEAKTFYNDWIGTEFLSGIQVERPISPRFYGGDMQAGIFVMEDLGEHRSLVQPLLDGESDSAEAASAAEAALLRYSASVGRLHAVSAGRSEAFEALYTGRLPGIRPMTFEQEEIGSRTRNVREQLERLGVKGSAALDAEISGIEEAVAHPGPFLAYIHADPCPDNVFDRGDHLLLIDFEIGHFGHALIDAVHPRMVWPTCWCANRLPGGILKQMESVYRAELVAGIPQAGEDALWETALAQMCGLAVLNTFHFHLEPALKEDRRWGRATFRQRLLTRLAVFIETADAFHQLPALRGTAHTVRDLLLNRWPDTPVLPVYPAFG